MCLVYLILESTNIYIQGKTRFYKYFLILEYIHVYKVQSNFDRYQNSKKL